MRRSSPVQQWLDSLPADAPAEPETSSDEVKAAEPKSDDSKAEETVTENTVIEPNKDKTLEDQSLDVPNVKEPWKRKSLDSGLLTSTPQKTNVKRLQRDHSLQSEVYSPKFKNPLLRDHSLQSDNSGSSGSSVLNVLGARKVDAESVLLALGFGPSEKQQKLQRIPDRFLAPSKLKGISTEDFIKNEQHSMRMHDCGIFGYRGLTGNPHVPPSTIVAKIIGCILQDEVCREEALIKSRHSIADMRTQPNINAILAARMRNN
ncbi:unnamed protein product [Chrysodeixis includens]|uniref:ITPR-interacting domain-containing protein n=1 Tax=Chrysodeixis includens TaxID=689277 RepID=A0A9P0BIF1_CHRIL|nr:unnamed protein product [Chrysodeixis includens]